MGMVHENIIYFDCQTTGMSPKSAHLVEIAWASSPGTELVSHLAQIPEGASFPRAAQSVTGINPSLLTNGLEPAALRAELLSFYEKIGRPKFAVIHYAQFERPFLEQLWGEALPCQFICTQRIAKKLLPQVPSRNIRALLGFLGGDAREIRRAGDHVAATQEIWRRLIPLLEAQGLLNLPSVFAWLQAPNPSAPKVKYEYRIDRLRRLELPRQPGVYRMLSSTGQVLYVGKATSLRERVNSYFRGQKGRNRKKLEMLSQVWDLSVTPCESPLEAAMLEVDEIKQFDPPYNVSLRAAGRKLCYYSRDFHLDGFNQSPDFPLGPFRAGGEIEALRLLWRGELRAVLYEEVEENVLAQGHSIFLTRWGSPSLRTFLARALWRYRELSKAEPLETEPENEISPEVEGELEPLLTAEEVATRLEGVILAAAEAIVRARELTRLLNARVIWEIEGASKELNLGGGRVGGERPESRLLPWRGLGLEEFDRMRVLRSELAREGGKVCSADKN